MENHHNILIVGAGPTGLMAAIELSRRNISYRIIDKAIKPVKTSNALAMQTRTLEIMNDIGLLEELLRIGYPLKTFHLYSKQGKIGSIDLSKTRSRFPFILGIAQHQTETVLLNYLKKIGGDVDMPTELIDIKQQKNFLEVRLKDKEGNETTESYAWVLACDGGKSVVREKLGIEFKGHELPQHFVMMDAHVKTDFPEHETTAFLSPNGPLIVIPYSNQYSRMIAEVTDDPELKNSKSPSSNDFERLIKERCYSPISFDDIIWQSGFWVRERLADEYRQNRVFFLGDAAHLHSPVGGQGMNTGIQDAHNLAWKLAMVYEDQAREKLLDSYEAERRPIAKEVLKASTIMTYLIALKNTALIKIRNFVMKKILNAKSLVSKITSQLSETKINYKKSFITGNDLSSSGIAAGTFIRDVKIQDKFLSDYFEKTKPVIIFFIPYQINRHVGLLNEIQELIEKNKNNTYDFLLIHVESLPENFSWKYNSIKDDNQKIFEAYKVTLPMTYLIRPDRYIGYRGKFNLRGFYRALDFLQIKHFPLS